MYTYNLYNFSKLTMKMKKKQKEYKLDLFSIFTLENHYNIKDQK